MFDCAVPGGGAGTIGREVGTTGRGAGTAGREAGTTAADGAGTTGREAGTTAADAAANAGKGPRGRPRGDAARSQGAIQPRLRHERVLWNRGLVRVAGVDEVGVAPASGPVVAAAVIMAPNCHRIPGVRDSKTLSAAQREHLAPIIRRRAVAVGVGAASVAEIDRLNIYHATHLAMRRAIAKLGGHEHVLVDGLRIREFEEHVGPYTAIVDGDALCYTIACASIVAKVVRDRLMTLLAARHPGYGWERNAGYATREHRAAMAELGLTVFHRRSFITAQRVLVGEQESFELELLPLLAPAG